MRRLHQRAGSRDTGTISMFTVLYTIPVLLMVGLLVDGGYAIHARQKAYDIAEQAARAGANDIDIATLRQTGNVQVDPNVKAVKQKVNAFIAAYPATISSHSTKLVTNAKGVPVGVSVTVTIEQKTSFLAIIPGLSEFTLTATASATPEEG